MLGLVALVAGVAGAAPPAPSAADVLAANALVASFVKYCGDTDGDPDKALAAADADGWQTPPAGAMPPTIPVMGADGVAHMTPASAFKLESRVRTSGAGVLVLVLSDVPSSGGGLHSCSVGGRFNVDTGALRDDLQRWAGGAPITDRTTPMATFIEFGLKFGAAGRQILDHDPMAKDPSEPGAATVAANVFRNMVTVTYSRTPG